MPINTSGSRLSVLPQYAPVDPSLVALNPSAVSGGIGQTFTLARLLDAIQFERQRQDELAQTRSLRVGAENAGNLASIQLAQPRVNDLLGGFGQRASIRPSETAAAIAGNELNVKRAEAISPFIGDVARLEGETAKQGLRALEPRTDAEIAVAAAKKAEAESEVRLAGTKERMTEEQMRSAIKDIGDAETMRNDKLKLAQDQLNDALQNSREDRDVKRAIDKFKIAKEAAETEYLRAHAKYYDQGGAQKTPRSYTQQLSELGLTMQRLQKGPYALPGGKEGDLAAYRAAVYDNNGKLKSVGQIPLVPDWATPNSKMASVSQDPNADMALELYALLQGNSVGLAQKAAMELSGQEPIQAATTQVSTTTTPGQTPSFSSIEEANRALAEGRIQKGQPIIVGGKPGKLK